MYILKTFYKRIYVALWGSPWHTFNKTLSRLKYIIQSKASSAKTTTTTMPYDSWEYFVEAMHRGYETTFNQTVNQRITTTATTLRSYIKHNEEWRCRCRRYDKCDKLNLFVRTWWTTERSVRYIGRYIYDDLNSCASVVWWFSYYFLHTMCCWEA